MTNDLISRSALLKKAIRVTETGDGGWERVLRAVPVEEIEAAEAVDAAPIKYGEFAITEEQLLPSVSVTIKRCEACKTKFILLFRNALGHNFCPRCGAKRREADNAQE